MITKEDYFAQLPKEIKQGFSELNVGYHLRKAHINKLTGYSCFNVFKLVFLLVFQYKNWFRAHQSKKAGDLPGKDTVYRFLNTPTFNWRQFLLSLSSEMIRLLKPLTSDQRVTAFILDDSVYSRNRSKSVELLAKVFDHSTHKYLKGFQMLTLGWTDSASFIPVDFALMSSSKKDSRIQEINETIDKRTSEYKRRAEAIKPKPTVVSDLLDHALNKGIIADYVLMDSWFTQAPLIKTVTDKGLFVIGMVKQLKQRYLYNGQRLTFPELYAKANPSMGKKDILGSIHVTLENGIPAKILFIRNRNKRSEWLAILSTDTTLDNEEIVRIYGMRWDIEVFFKCNKSLLNLEKEFQGRSYDMLISHTTIVYTRYILIAWQMRKEADPKTFGNLFYILCEDVKDMDYLTALQSLIDIFQTLAEAKVVLDMDIFKSQMNKWLAALPSYFKQCLNISRCES
ncbi:IS4 family transposase [Ureibacillus manganicus]|uniref:Transposase n=1 Tax=Ureibacillus manganicus DSM 26584 TaxID=1384049 RepID=A0A0A3I3A7_9BACL|nr:transposase [Ureibacillus manganicus]KGR77163.1 transposase [Ureibacillus manganicus DSM 26584]